MTDPNAAGLADPAPGHSEPGAATRETACGAPASQPGPGALVRYFLRLGTLGFGGPIAVVGYMQRDLVEARGWISKQDFLDGVALGQTMPGPLAAQVAMWAGYLGRGPAGAGHHRHRPGHPGPAVAVQKFPEPYVVAAGILGILLH